KYLCAIDLLCYKSFTEIRQEHKLIGKQYQYFFSNSEYSNIIDGSLSWDGSPILKQEVYNSVENLKGQEVIVHRTTNCGGEGRCEDIEAKIVDPNTLLLENTESGTYFYADSRNVDYKTKPLDAGTTLSIDFVDQKPRNSGTLSYLVRSITWTPRYALSISTKGVCNLKSYANIRNNMQQEYSVENTRLLGGDVPLASSYSSSPVIRTMALSKAVSTQADSVTADGNQMGIYSYTFPQKYTLRPASTITIPFVDILCACDFSYAASVSIGATVQRGTFQRRYALTPNQFMPSGIVTIRDQQLLVGQANLPDVPANYTQIVSVGQDSDVRYYVESNLTSSEEKPVVRYYNVLVTLSNYKDKSVQAKLEIYGALQTSVIDNTSEDVSVKGNVISVGTNLKSKGNSTYVLSVRLQYN
ncbi:unnamed protein product, partial [Didymodactylos carnosus]